jgi:hypothetical protein
MSADDTTPQPVPPVRKRGRPPRVPGAPPHEHGQRTIPVVFNRLRERGVKLTEQQLRRAVWKGEIRSEMFGGLPRIPQSEEDRIAALLGQDAT